MASPVQIILNPENYEEAREAGGGGGRKDFFAHKDREFIAHRSALISQLDAISGTLSAQAQGPVGFVKVVLRREAWAKSHRPVATLFRQDRVPVVGGGDLGVMIVEAQPESLRKVAAEIGRAETHTEMRFDPYKEKEVPHPSSRKSETGAIERIELYSPADRRNFSIEEAVAWLSNPVTGSGYEVELFDAVPPRGDWDRLDAGHRRLVESFLAGFNNLGFGVSVERLPHLRRHQPLLSVRVDEGADGAVLLLVDPPLNERRRVLAPFSADLDRHVRLLAFLDKHPLVRRIGLPGIVVRAAQPQGSTRARPAELTLPIRDTRRTHPRLGVIDGGISDALSDWVIDRWDVLADEDMNHAHGTFIGGLAVAGASLNGTATCPEADGAELVDVAIFPDEAGGAFANYYSGGLPHFFDEMEAAVADARARHGVRVFNMSLNILQPAAPDAYSAHAVRLDRIAEDNNAVIFMSAGNIRPQDLRPE
jgi:hypothetical protein